MHLITPVSLVETNGTYLVGSISGIGHEDLTKALGQPLDGIEKTDLEWSLGLATYSPPIPFTVYNWKNGPNTDPNLTLEGIDEWHVGGTLATASAILETLREHFAQVLPKHRVRINRSY